MVREYGTGRGSASANGSGGEVWLGEEKYLPLRVKVEAAMIELLEYAPEEKKRIHTHDTSNQILRWQY